MHEFFNDFMTDKTTFLLTFVGVLGFIAALIVLRVIAVSVKYDSIKESLEKDNFEDFKRIQATIRSEMELVVFEYLRKKGLIK